MLEISAEVRQAEGKIGRIQAFPTPVQTVQSKTGHSFHQNPDSAGRAGPAFPFENCAHASTIDRRSGEMEKAFFTRTIGFPAPGSSQVCRPFSVGILCVLVVAASCSFPDSARRNVEP